MAENSEDGQRAGGATFFTKWFWLWLVVSAAYAVPVMHYADTSRPTQSEIKKAWIYDALVLIAEHKGAKDRIVEVQRLFPQVPDDDLLRLIDEYWAAEALAYRATYRIEPAFREPVEALKAKYRARLAAGPLERETAQLVSALTWALPVLAGLLVLLLAYPWKRPGEGAARRE